MSAASRRALLVLVLAGVLVSPPAATPRAQSPSPFATQIASLSEPAGYFDTDNLISNERSYLQVLPDLTRRQVRGGAYIGVGPDQNFTYIAEVRPSIAFIVDVRRDNLHLHLLFKALFALSRTRVEYLAQLFGRPLPGDIDAWRTASVDKLIAYIDGTPAAPKPRSSEGGPVHQAIARAGVPLSTEDLATIDRFHRRFIDEGLSLRIPGTGRAPQRSHPPRRRLLPARA